MINFVWHSHGWQLWLLLLPRQFCRYSISCYNCCLPRRRRKPKYICWLFPCTHWWKSCSICLLSKSGWKKYGKNATTFCCVIKHVLRRISAEKQIAVRPTYWWHMMVFFFWLVFRFTTLLFIIFAYYHHSWQPMNTQRRHFDVLRKRKFILPICTPPPQRITAPRLVDCVIFESFHVMDIWLKEIFCLPMSNFMFQLTEQCMRNTKIDTITSNKSCTFSRRHRVLVSKGVQFPLGMIFVIYFTVLLHFNFLQMLYRAYQHSTCDPLKNDIWI